MEKRLALFCLLAALILGGQLMLQTLRQSSVEPEGQVANGDSAANPAAAVSDGQIGSDPAQGGKDASSEDGVPKDGASKDGAPSASEAKSPAPNEATAKDNAAKPGNDAIAPRPPAVRKTLGSLDPASGYRLMATFHSVGAVVERIELSPTQYRDLDEKFGYLGHLGLALSSDGSVRVGVVGPGTPAALAKSDNPADPPGLAAGDVLEAVDGVVVESNQALRQVLVKTKPGDALKLRVRRDGRVRDYTAQLGTPP
ncbi:MAG: PDZ domain-containing protein, partial [Planctomycetota bacterium]